MSPVWTACSDAMFRGTGRIDGIKPTASGLIGRQCKLFLMVAGDRIELPTLRFSVACSTN